jgi:hypothetical protein
MIRIPLGLLMLVCGGCSPNAPLYIEGLHPYVPIVEATCPFPARDPTYPHRVVSVQALRLFAQEAEEARVADKRSLHECTSRLHKAVAVLDALRAGQPTP